ncbi:MAG TPA: protoporphyrinogen oxidase [bacterium]|nr:protoporphyrinogen oxidase [bacterium]
MIAENVLAKPQPLPSRAELLRVVVVGGGIAGLAAAHRLVELGRARRPPVELVLVEARDRLGGVVATERADGYLIEEGPDSFLTEKPWGLSLCDRLGLTGGLVPTREGSRRTFIVCRGRLVPLPDGFLVLAPSRLGPILRSPLLSWRGKLRLAMDLVLPKRQAGGDESVGAFVTRRFGREVLDRVVQPLVSGIYGADPFDVSLAAAMPRFVEMERQHRSIIRALRRAQDRRPAVEESGPRWSLFVTLAGGMGELVSAAARRLPPASVKLRRRVTSLARSRGPRPWRVNLADGTALLADGVILAIPAPRAARLVAGLDPDLGRALAAISYASSAIVTLAYRREEIRHALDGFGFVVPHAEDRQILGCTFSSLKFPGRAPDGVVLLRVFLGGARARELLDRDDAALGAAAQQELEPLLGISGSPHLVRVHRHVAAMPQYQVGHAERVAAIEGGVARHPGLAVAGNALGGVGIPDCIHSGERAAERVLAQAQGQAS